MTRLFDLLPAFHRLRDTRLAQSQVLLTSAEQALVKTLQGAVSPLAPGQQLQLDELIAKATRGPLESLLLLIEEQLAVIAEDLDQFYDDQFIETCAPWVIPYIGDLVGYQAVNGIAPSVASPRAEVANILSFRRRKGTILVMEQLARDVTGWGAHAVEFFQFLTGSQYMNLPRPENHYAPDLRRYNGSSASDIAFDRTSHTVDVRRISAGRGLYNIQNIGIFLWSLNSYSRTRSPATGVAAAPQCFRFSPLGMDVPLFNNPISQGSDVTASASPLNVPARLSRDVLCDDLQKGIGAAYYGEGNSLALYAGGKLIDAHQLQVCNLSGLDGSWINLPQAGSSCTAAVDPELGRIAIPPPAAGGQPPVLAASFHYGFNADLGGGEYARSSTFIVQDPAWVFPFPDTASPSRYSTLQEALAFAVGELAHKNQIAVEISDSGVYAEPALDIDLPAGAIIELRAAQGSCPTVILSGEFLATGGPASSFALNGIVIRGPAVHAAPTRPDASPSQLGQLLATHCTLVPSASSMAVVAEPPGLALIVSKSILGAIRIAALSSAIIADSIVDSTASTSVAYAAIDGSDAGGALTLTGCTVIGKVHSTLLALISNSIFSAALTPGDLFKAPLWSDRKQSGCVRCSYLPPGSLTPRKFNCIDQGAHSPQPLFSSLRYGDPAYAKLLPSTPAAVRGGADDGGEMGAFHFVLAPLRELDLRTRLQEYTPAGMEFGIMYRN